MQCNTRLLLDHWRKTSVVSDSLLRRKWRFFTLFSQDKTWFYHPRFPFFWCWRSLLPQDGLNEWGKYCEIKIHLLPSDNSLGQKNQVCFQPRCHTNDEAPLPVAARPALIVNRALGMDFPHSCHAQTRARAKISSPALPLLIFVDIYVCSRFVHFAGGQNTQCGKSSSYRNAWYAGQPGIVFLKEKRKRKKGKTPVRIRNDAVPPRSLCQGPTAYTKRAKKTMGKQQSPFFSVVVFKRLSAWVSRHRLTLVDMAMHCCKLCLNYLR